MVKIKNLSAHEHVEDICNTFDGLSEMVEDRRLEHAGDDGTVLTEVQVEHLLTVVLSLVYQSGTNVAQFSGGPDNSRHQNSQDAACGRAMSRRWLYNWPRAHLPTS